MKRCHRPLQKLLTTSASVGLAQAYAAERQFGNLTSEAFERLVATAPDTLRGAAAMLRYVRTGMEQGFPMCEEDTTIALLGSIECAISKTANLPARAADR